MGKGNMKGKGKGKGRRRAVASNIIFLIIIAAIDF
jgi:hypothetical protein